MPSLVGYRAGYRVKKIIDVPVQIGVLDKMKLGKCAPISGKPAIGVLGLPRLNTRSGKAARASRRQPARSAPADFVGLIGTILAGSV